MRGRSFFAAAKAHHLVEYLIIPRGILKGMKLGVSLPNQLVGFADKEAERRGTTRSGLIAELLEVERVRQQVRQYIDRHGWDITDSEESWRKYQRQRTEQEYGDDDW